MIMNDNCVTLDRKDRASNLNYNHSWTQPREKANYDLDELKFAALANWAPYSLTTEDDDGGKLFCGPWPSMVKTIAEMTHTR